MVRNYKACAIEVFARPLGSGSFSAYGCVRNFGQVGPELPSAFIVDTDGWKHSTKSVALAAGLELAKSVVDKAREK